MKQEQKVAACKLPWLRMAVSSLLPLRSVAIMSLLLPTELSFNLIGNELTVQVNVWEAFQFYFSVKARNSFLGGSRFKRFYARIKMRQPTSCPE